MQAHFDAVVELNAAARAAYFERELAGDAALRAAVERLLRAADEVRTGFVDEVVSGAAQQLASGEDRSGLVLGPYRLLGELGRGGMGTVWLAERADEAYSARVAIKLVRGGFANKELERRFRAERQILADLRHPNIARLLDGGAAPDGTPFLVMEYVEGVPITEYASAHSLTTRERLALFREVCDAVQHAHASLVVHRDIKPSNILVGADGVPKLMDFGIAKPLEPGAGTETTELVRPMTPAYASPEQIRGERITVATDVYSLGVLLYELLTGVQPFAAGESGPIDVQRRVLEDEPRAPSTVVGSRDPTRPATVRELAGDLDNIVARAIAKEPDRRYGSVAALAEDVRRHLEGEPVAARAPTMAYRLGKFVRRRRIEVTVAAAALLLLTAFSAYYTARLARERDVAQQERAIAERERQTAEQVSDFLANMFWSADPGQTLGDTVTALDLLERGRERLDTALVSAPDVRARMFATLGYVHHNLARYADARALLERAVTLMDSTGAGDSAVTGQTVRPLRTLAAVLSTMGQRDSALIVGQRSVAAAKAAGDSAQLALALMAVGDAHTRGGELEASLAAMQEALVVSEAVFGRDALETARVLESLASVHIQRREYEQGIEPARRSVAIRRQQLDPRDPLHMGSLANYAIVLWQTGQADSARALLQESLHIGLASYGNTHPRVTGVRMTLAQILGSSGDYDGAIAEMKAGLAADEQLLPPGNPRIGAHHYNIGLAYREKGDPASALPWLQRAVEILEQGVAPESPALESPLFQLGVTLHQLGRYREALTHLQRARTVVEHNQPEGSPRFVRIFMTLGSTWDRLGNAEAALDLLTRAVQIEEAASGPEHRDLTFPLNNLASFHLRHENYTEAARLYERSVAIMERSRPDDVGSVLPEYARALRGAGQNDRAAEIERRAHTGS